MSIQERTDHSYTLRDLLRDLLMDTALVIVYGVVLISNFMKEVKDVSRYKH